MQKIPLSEHATIISLFTTQKRSMLEIANKYGVYKTTILKILRLANVDTSIHTVKIPNSVKSQIIEDFRRLKSVNEVAKLHNRDASTISRFLKKNHIETDFKKAQKLTSEVLQRYIEEKSPRDIATQYGISYESVCRIVKTRPELHVNHYFRKYKLNKHYFDNIDDEYKAYFLGLFFADGCNSEGVGIDIALQEGDEYLLKQLIQKLYPNNDKPLQKILPKKENRKIQYRLGISSTDLSKAMSKHGAVPKKSLILKYPYGCFEQSLFGHFLRGYFDGDGSIWLDDRKKRLHFTLDGTYDFLFSIRKELETQLNVSIPNKIYTQPRTKIFELVLSKRHLLQGIYHLLYDNATIYMFRKKLIFDGILQDRIKTYISPRCSKCGSFKKINTCSKCNNKKLDFLC
jgi:predicted DNA-binding protein YlxM (UPF0122 family)